VSRYCIDNGAMIAWTGMLMFKSGITTPMEDTWCTQRCVRWPALPSSHNYSSSLRSDRSTKPFVVQIPHGCPRSAVAGRLTTSVRVGCVMVRDGGVGG
jgi:hypothetical protein